VPLLAGVLLLGLASIAGLSGLTLVVSALGV
jgi:hypothetical protein